MHNNARIKAKSFVLLFQLYIRNIYELLDLSMYPYDIFWQNSEIRLFMAILVMVCGGSRCRPLPPIRCHQHAVVLVILRRRPSAAGAGMRRPKAGEQTRKACTKSTMLCKISANNNYTFCLVRTRRWASMYMCIYISIKHSHILCCRSSVSP